MVEALKLDLAAEVLTSCGQARLPVTGSSMLPALWPGDLLDVQRSAEIRPGDVVVYQRHGRLVVHRVASRSGDQITTHGDRLKHPDLPVPAAEILGRVVGVERRGRSVQPHRRPMLSWLLSRSEFCTRVALRLHRA
ncbi:MAG: S24 family peptidase [Bryobacteraceae bacterium]